MRKTLHDGWRLRAIAGPLPDAVAGRHVPADDMLVSLPAGENHRFLVRTTANLPQPSTLVHPRVLRCANTAARAVENLRLPLPG